MVEEANIKTDQNPHWGFWQGKWGRLLVECVSTSFLVPGSLPAISGKRIAVCERTTPVDHSRLDRPLSSVKERQLNFPGVCSQQRVQSYLTVRSAVSLRLHQCPQQRSATEDRSLQLTPICHDSLNKLRFVSFPVTGILHRDLILVKDIYCSGF